MKYQTSTIQNEMNTNRVSNLLLCHLLVEKMFGQGKPCQPGLTLMSHPT